MLREASLDAFDVPGGRLLLKTQPPAGYLNRAAAVVFSFCRQRRQIKTLPVENDAILVQHGSVLHSVELSVSRM